MANSIGQSCNKCINHPVFICILRFFQWLPVFFIVAVVSWAYYAYVIELCFFTVNNILERIVYLIPFHVFLVLFLWSYYQTVFTKVGAPSSKFVMPPEVLSDLEEAPRATDHRLILDRFQRDRDLPIAMRAFDGAVRFCDKCKLVKPDRCHHCSVCGQCVLKFDHHCPWVNTCVNFRNYKFFIQFLGYALVFCLFIFFTDFKYFIWFWETGLKEEGASKFHIMFMFFVSGMFAISVSTLFFYHLWLTSRNRTTIESFRDPVFTYGPDKHGFSLGWRQNFMEVFGERPLLWFLPVFSARGNGCDFKTPNRLRGERDARHRDEAAGESRDQQDPEDPDGTPGSANGKSNPPGRSSPGRSSPRNGSLSGSPRPNQWLPETGPWGSDKPTDRIVGKNSTDRGKRDSYGSDGYLSSRSRTLPENSGRISSSMLIDEILSKDQSPHLSSASPSSFDRVEQIRHGNGLSFPTPTYEAETDSLLTAQRSEQMQQDNDSDVERRMTQYNPHSNYPHSDRPSHDEFRDDDDGWGKFTAAEPPPDPLVMRDIPLNSIATPILITARS